MIRSFESRDKDSLTALWNTAGVPMGYASLDREKLDALIFSHPAFAPAHTFVLEKNGTVHGLALGCVQGTRGHMGCLIAPTQADTAALVSALEDAFRRSGCSESMVSFWCPIRLPWVIPGTNGHQHNNVPGVPVDLPLHAYLAGLGYEVKSRETAMYLDLSGFEIPETVEDKAARMARKGYTVALYDGNTHRGLKEMVDTLGNPLWSEEIPAAGAAGLRLLVGLKGDQVAGFAGPIYPEESGRGYFSGIGVAPAFENHGLGKLLFYRLCREEKLAGAQYMSLFTGAENPARFIYEGAGFRVCRSFDVMRKAL